MVFELRVLRALRGKARFLDNSKLGLITRMLKQIKLRILPRKTLSSLKAEA